MSFLEYMERLKELCHHLGYHWIATDYKKGFRLLNLLYSEYGLKDGNTYLVRNCSQKHCLNPLHYSLKERYEQPKDVDLDEVEALIPMINLEELETYGFREYLKAFNNRQPLPARVVDFWAACNRKLSNTKKPLLSKEFLRDGDDF